MAKSKKKAPARRGGSPSTKRELERLRDELDEKYGLQTAGYRGWHWSYEYPGIFQFTRPGSPLIVAHTPDYNDDGAVCVQVTDEGDHRPQFDLSPAAERYSRPLTAAKLMKIVGPVLRAVDEAEGRSTGRGRGR